MTSTVADILGFVAFGAVWLFPIAILISVLSFAGADAKTRREDMGPNVVPFPQIDPATKPQELKWPQRIFRLAFRGRAD